MARQRTRSARMRFQVAGHWRLQRLRPTRPRSGRRAGAAARGARGRARSSRARPASPSAARGTGCTPARSQSRVVERPEQVHGLPALHAELVHQVEDALVSFERARSRRSSRRRTPRSRARRCGRCARAVRCSARSIVAHVARRVRGTTTRPASGRSLERVVIDVPEQRLHGVRGLAQRLQQPALRVVFGYGSHSRASMRSRRRLRSRSYADRIAFTSTDDRRSLARDVHSRPMAAQRPPWTSTGAAGFDDAGTRRAPPARAASAWRTCTRSRARTGRSTRACCSSREAVGRRGGAITGVPLTRDESARALRRVPRAGRAAPRRGVHHERRAVQSARRARPQPRRPPRRRSARCRPFLERTLDAVARAGGRRARTHRARGAARDRAARRGARVATRASRCRGAAARSCRCTTPARQSTLHRPQARRRPTGGGWARSSACVAAQSPATPSFARLVT